MACAAQNFFLSWNASTYSLKFSFKVFALNIFALDILLCFVVVSIVRLMECRLARETGF